ERAVMAQIIGLLDAYAYRTLVWDIYVERVDRPLEGMASDEARIPAALPAAETCLATLAALKRPGPFLLGEQLTLADLHAAPMFGYFVKAPEGAAMLARHAALADWWRTVSSRASMALAQTEA